MLKNNGFHNRHSPPQQFSPASFFANGEQGWWFDPSNFATLFQDSAGTTPVTAVEQPVGLQLDLSQGLVLGPELVTNGDFSSATGWSTTGGWSISGGNLVGTVAANSASQNSVTTAGVWYKVSFNYSATLGNVIRICNTSGTALISFTTSSGTSGAVTGYFLATGSTVFIEAALANYTGTIDNFSIKALAGNHRFQTTSANRPVVSARVNLLTKTEEFDNAAWSKSSTTVAATGYTDPLGGNTARLMLETTANAVHEITQSQSTFVSGQTIRLSVSVKANGRDFVALFLAGYKAIVFDLVNLTATVSGAGNGSPVGTIVDSGNGWRRCTYECLLVSTPSSVGFGTAISTTYGAFAGDASKGVYLWGADLRSTTQGVNLPAYQRVNTSTDYDSTGFPVYIKPNGSNQFMQTNSINFTATDKMTVWAGSRVPVYSPNAMIYSTGPDPTATAGTFALRLNSPTQVQSLLFGSSLSNFEPTVPAFPSTFVTTQLLDIGASTNLENGLKVNGAAATYSSGAAGTGNFASQPAYFFAFNGASNFFNGNDYGSIARGAASTAAQIANGETYINSKTKAYT